MIFRQDVLSSYMHICSQSLLRKLASLVASTNAITSASVDEVAVYLVCFFDFQDIGEFPKKKIYPVIALPPYRYMKRCANFTLFFVLLWCRGVVVWLTLYIFFKKY